MIVNKAHTILRVKDFKLPVDGISADQGPKTGVIREAFPAGLWWPHGSRGPYCLGKETLYLG